MGYDPEIDLTLKFDETKYEGAEVTVRVNPSMDIIMLLEDLETSAQWIRLLMVFGQSVLLSWNVVNEEVPVPATGPGFLSQPMEFCELIVQSWREAANIDVDNDKADSDIIEDLGFGNLSVADKQPIGVDGTES